MSTSRTTISPYALVADNALLGEGVSIGPFAVVGRNGHDVVKIGAGTQILDHALVEPGAVIGADCIIEHHCRIGGASRIADGSRVASGLEASRHAPRRDSAFTVPSVSTEPEAQAEVSNKALIASNADLKPNVSVGPFAVIGWDSEDPVSVGENTIIAPFALIEPGVKIGERCLIDAYCRIGTGTVIGDDTQILYGAAVFENVEIGQACIIGGNLADRTVVEDCVTYFGEVAHDYRHPGDLDDWDKVVTPSPRICRQSVVGQYAVLVGGITVGPRSYIAAGEVVRVNVPEDQFYSKGKLIPLKNLKGIVKVRTDCADQ